MLKIETFKSLLNTKFKAHFDNKIIYEFELIDIKEGAHIPSLDISPFTLEFRSDPNSAILNQGNYHLMSHDNQAFTLLLLPRKSNEEGIYYDSIIS